LWSDNEDKAKIKSHGNLIKGLSFARLHENRYDGEVKEIKSYEKKKKKKLYNQNTFSFDNFHKKRPNSNSSEHVVSKSLSNEQRVQNLQIKTSSVSPLGDVITRKTVKIGNEINTSSYNHMEDSIVLRSKDLNGEEYAVDLNNYNLDSPHRISCLSKLVNDMSPAFNHVGTEKTVPYKEISEKFIQDSSMFKGFSEEEKNGLTEFNFLENQLDLENSIIVGQ